MSEAESPAIGISFKQALDDGRELVFQGFVPATCSQEELNSFLDKLTTASERQKAMALLPTFKGEVEDFRARLAYYTNELLLAEAERQTMADLWRKQAGDSNRRNWQPAASQKQDALKIEARIKQAEKDIDAVKKKLAAEESRVALYEARLGG